LGGLVFVGILATGALVVIWYVQNRHAGADGIVGLLALRDDPAAAKPGAKCGSYRMKMRKAPPGRQRRKATPPEPEIAEKRTYTVVGEAECMRRRFRRQDEARYVVKDKASPFVNRNDDD